MIAWASVALAADCVKPDGEVDLKCLGGTAPIQLREHSIGGPGSDPSFVRSRYPGIAGCVSAMPLDEGAVAYELRLGPGAVVTGVARDPESTVDLDACMRVLFVGQTVPGATDTTNPVRFTVSWQRETSIRPTTLTEDLGRLCDVAAKASPGIPLTELATSWGLLAPQTEALVAAVQGKPRTELYAALVAGAEARGVSWTCPALQKVLAP